ncbi:MAG TPA: SIMPL domain-containing protein [Anaeromyxobacteraceae bacterium]
MRLASTALIAAIAASSSAPSPQPSPPPVERGKETPATLPSRTLRVSGEGRASAAPDLAIFTVAVTALDPSLARATRDANERARKLLDALSAAGVADADRQTVRFDVQLERNVATPRDPPRITGYRVTNAIAVNVRDLAKLGTVLDRALATGADEVESLSLTRADSSPERATALAAAVRAARAKAEVMAKAAGLRLGQVLELSEGARGPSPIPLRATFVARAAGGVPIAEGQLEVEAQVELTFAVD